MYFFSSTLYYTLLLLLLYAKFFLLFLHFSVYHYLCCSKFGFYAPCSSDAASLTHSIHNKSWSIETEKNSIGNFPKNHVFSILQIWNVYFFSFDLRLHFSGRGEAVPSLYISIFFLLFVLPISSNQNLTNTHTHRYANTQQYALLRCGARFSLYFAGFIAYVYVTR